MKSSKLKLKYLIFSSSRATHSEIEKRRRQKMNKHLNELAFHLPGINTKSKKPDKLTILKLAVQHLKNLKGFTIFNKRKKNETSYL